MIELSWCYADAERLLLPSLNNPSVDHAFKCMRDRSPLTRICMFPPVPREHCLDILPGLKAEDSYSDQAETA